MLVEVEALILGKAASVIFKGARMPSLTDEDGSRAIDNTDDVLEVPIPIGLRLGRVASEYWVGVM